MKISQVGIDLIKSFEGCCLRAYKDVVGVWTIGYGSTANVKEGQIITQQQAEELLKKDLVRFENGVNEAVKVTISQPQFDALVSFSYNLGVMSLKTSTLLELLNKGETEKAANEFDKWVKAGGKVLTGLQRRRHAEKEMFLSTVTQVAEQKEVVKLYNPGATMKQSTKNVLEQMAKVENGINKVWIEKLEKGTLTESEAIGLLFISIERGLMK